VYNLFCGNSHASTPHYDLQSFTDSIHSKLPVVLHGILSNNFQQGAKTEQARNYGWLIWLSVGIVLLLLILLTLKMTKEVSQRSAKINNTHREGDQ
jgi:heme exporter protein D